MWNLLGKYLFIYLHVPNTHCHIFLQENCAYLVLTSSVWGCLVKVILYENLFGVKITQYWWSESGQDRALESGGLEGCPWQESRRTSLLSLVSRGVSSRTLAYQEAFSAFTNAHQSRSKDRSAETLGQDPFHPAPRLNFFPVLLVIQSLPCQPLPAVAGLQGDKNMKEHRASVYY